MVTHLTNPFDALLGLQRALDSTRSSNWFGMGTSNRGAFPPINVFQKGDDFVLVAEIPGADKSNVDIKVKNNQVHLKGKKDVSLDDGVSVHRRERMAGEFARSLTLPTEIEADKVQAEYRNGVLAIFLPRAESDKPRSVSIN